MPSVLTPKEIRQTYADYTSEWQSIYQEGKIDMRFVAGDPWEPADRRARQDAGRPCISPDELNQYLNVWEGNLRQAKRSIQLLPVGNGAKDKQGELRENMVRGIEYQSKAQQVYISAGVSMAQRSYGFALIRTQYVSDEDFNQKIVIKRVPNPDSVAIDPYYKEADASDMMGCFITDLMSKREFKRRFKGAKIQSFTGEHSQEAPNWIRENYVQVAEFWKVNQTQRNLLRVQFSAQGEPLQTNVFEDELSQKMKGQPFQVVKRRKVTVNEVVQYLTNGLEILDEIPWLGSRIPTVCCFGRELYMDEGGGPKRKLMSMVRLARDPQMLLAYLASCECEEAGMSPKAPFVGAKGQFKSDQEAWATVSNVPHAFLQYDPVVEAATGTVLPPPSRPQYEPHFQEFEIAKDAARRAIQAAMGISPLPTAAQRQNEKSGVALEKIQTQEAVGSYAFTDNVDRFLHNAGWQINELLDLVYDTARDVPSASSDGKYSVLRINDERYEMQFPEKDHLHTNQGQYDVTVSTGPSYESQREAQSSFVDTLIQNLPNLPPSGSPAAKILALAVKMRPDLGPIGRDIADILDPPQANDLPPQAQAAVSQLQGQVQQMGTQLQALHMERAAKQLELNTKAEIERLNNITKIVVAMITASKDSDRQAAQIELQRLGLLGDVYQAAHDAAHETALSQMQHAQQAQQNQQQLAIAAQKAQQPPSAQPSQPQA